MTRRYTPRRLESCAVLLVAVLAVLGLLVGAGMGMLSRYDVQEMLIDAAQEEINGRLDVTAVEWSTLRDVELSGLKLQLPDEETCIVKAQRTDVLLDWPALLRGDPRVQRVALVNPVIHLICDDNGVFNVDRVPRKKEKKKHPSKRRRQNAQEKYQLRQGVVAENAVVGLRSRHLYDDDKERVIRGVDMEWRHSHESLEKWRFNALIREGPLQDMEVSGRANFDTGEIFVALYCADLNLSPETLDLVPIVGRTIQQDWQPTGRAALRTNIIQRRAHTKLSYNVTIDAIDASFKPHFMPLLFEHVSGRIDVDDDVIVLSNLQGIIGGRQGRRPASDGELPMAVPGEITRAFTHEQKSMPPQLVVDGRIDPSRNTGILRIRGEDIVLSEPIVKAIPDYGDQMWRQYHPAGDVGFDARIQLGGRKTKPNRYTADIRLRGGGMILDKFPVPLSDIQGNLRLTERGVPMLYAEGRTCGGMFTSMGRIMRISPDLVHFTGQIALRKVNVRELLDAVSNKQQSLSGELTGSAYVEGSSNDLSTLEVVGTAELKQGYIADIPGLLRVLRLLKLSVPRREAFESAAARFYTRRRTIYLQELTIKSPSVGLTGKGTVGFDGALDLTLITATPAEKGGVPILQDVVDFMVSGVQRTLIQVTVSGTLDDPKIKKRILRPVQEGIEGVFDTIKSPLERVLPGTERKRDNE